MEYFNINRYSYTGGPAVTAYITPPNKESDLSWRNKGPSNNIIYMVTKARPTEYSRPPGKHHPAYGRTAVPTIPAAFDIPVYPQSK